MCLTILPTSFPIQFPFSLSETAYDSHDVHVWYDYANFAFLSGGEASISTRVFNSKNLQLCTFCFMSLACTGNNSHNFTKHLFFIEPLWSDLLLHVSPGYGGTYNLLADISVGE